MHVLIDILGLPMSHPKNAPMAPVTLYEGRPDADQVDAYAAALDAAVACGMATRQAVVDACGCAALWVFPGEAAAVFMGHDGPARLLRVELHQSARALLQSLLTRGGK